MVVRVAHGDFDFDLSLNKNESFVMARHSEYSKRSAGIAEVLRDRLFISIRFLPGENDF